MASRMLLTMTMTTAVPTAPRGTSVQTLMRNAMPAAKSSETKTKPVMIATRNRACESVKTPPTGLARAPEPNAISPMTYDRTTSATIATRESRSPMMSFCRRSRRLGTGAASR